MSYIDTCRKLVVHASLLVLFQVITFFASSADATNPDDTCNVGDGSIISFFDTPGTEPQGLTFDGAYFWHADSGSDTIHKLDKSGDIIDSFASPGPSPRGLTFDGMHLWNADALTDKIYKLDVTGNIIDSFASPGTWAKGLTFDGGYLWYAESSTDKIYKLDVTGNIIDSFDSPGTTPRGLAFDGTHLWHANASNEQIYKIGAAGNIISTFDSPGMEPRGLVFDGTHLWNADSEEDRIYQLNIGTCTKPDIKANGADGPLTISESDQLSIIVTLDPHNHDSENADWWVYAQTPFGWFYYEYQTDSWIYVGLSFNDVLFTYQGPLFTLPPYEVLNIFGLPEGTYTLYFALDTDMNGVLDIPSFKDSVIVDVAAQGITCDYGISSTNTSLGFDGGTGAVTVTAPSQCNWAAASNNSWITITSGSSGSGNGTVNYAVAANTSTNARTGTMTIAGKTFTVAQEARPSGVGSCSSDFTGRWRSNPRPLCTAQSALRKVYLDIDVKSDCSFQGKFDFYYLLSGRCEKVGNENSTSGEIDASEREGEIILESKRYEFEITEKSSDVMRIELTSDTGGFSGAKATLYKQ